MCLLPHWISKTLEVHHLSSWCAVSQYIYFIFNSLPGPHSVCGKRAVHRVRWWTLCTFGRVKRTRLEASTTAHIAGTPCLSISTTTPSGLEAVRVDRRLQRNEYNVYNNIISLTNDIRRIYHNDTNTWELGSCYLIIYSQTRYYGSG